MLGFEPLADAEIEEVNADVREKSRSSKRSHGHSQSQSQSPFPSCMPSTFSSPPLSFFPRLPTAGGSEPEARGVHNKGRSPL